MSEVTPTKAPYRQLDVSGTLDPDDDDSDGLPRNGSRTPGSPTKCGGRTMWTKDEDEDEIPSISGMDAESGSAPVVTQVTQSADLEAPRYHASTRPTSFRRARVGSIGRGPRRRGFLGSLLCCFRAQETDGDGKHSPGVSSPPAHSTVPSASAMHVGAAFIPPLLPVDAGKPCLVLDLDETLVHSSFKPVPNPDYVIPVEIDGVITDVYVLKRPWVDYFMEEVAALYEIVVFTASLAKYADPLLDLLDKKRVIRHRLFRESCYLFQGNYVKDLTCLGRDMRRVIIVDNSPHSYAFQPQNALPVSSFIDDPRDNDLLDMLPYLGELAEAPNVADILVANDGFVPRRSFYSRGLPVPHHRQFA